MVSEFIWIEFQKKIEFFSFLSEMIKFKLATAFYAVNFRTHSTPSFVEKCSRINSRIVLASRSIQVTCFRRHLCLKLNFKKKLWFFQKNFELKITAKVIRIRSDQHISCMFDISKLSIFLGIHSRHTVCHIQEKFSGSTMDSRTEIGRSNTKIGKMRNLGPDLDKKTRNLPTNSVQSAHIQRSVEQISFSTDLRGRYESQ